MKRLLLFGVIMATFTMFGAIITTRGDEQGALAYLGEANRYLYQLRMNNKTGEYAMPARKFSDGTIIRVKAAGGNDYADIYKPISRRGGEIKITIVKPYLYMVGDHFYNDGGAYGGISDILLIDRKTGALAKEHISSPTNYIFEYWYGADAWEDELYVVGKWYDDYSAPEIGWVVEKWQGGKKKWRREYQGGRVTAVVADAKHVYAVGTDYNGGFLSYYVRIEKINKSDGSLVSAILTRNADLGTNGSDMAHSCAVDADNLYVSATASKVSLPQFIEGRVMTIRKKDFTVTGSWADTRFTEPYPQYRELGIIDVATKNKTGSGVADAYMLSTYWLKKLDGTELAAHTYGQNRYDEATKDCSIFVDDSGIYTAAPLPAVNGATTGYEVVKRDFDNNIKWTRAYTDEATPATPLSSNGPAASDITADEKNLYIVGYKKTSASSYVYSFRQAIDKKTGDIQWSVVGNQSQGAYLWGLAMPIKVSEITIKE